MLKFFDSQPVRDLRGTLSHASLIPRLFASERGFETAALKQQLSALLRPALWRKLASVLPSILKLLVTVLLFD